MVALVQTVAYLGLEARGVEVQCQIAPGLPRFNVVGLPDKAVKESQERVHAALASMGLSLPPKRITINLSPADLPKEGSHYDLPIALALLAAMGVTDAEQLIDFVAVGELALDGRISRTRPFRTPHHSASMAALTGGGLKVRPGEVSLAHLGVLFLDELPEFQRAVLDSLRQPLETGVVDVARANANVTYPARVQLVAAMNPCRCGHLGDQVLGCSRAPRRGADYQSKVSGPLLDRIDLHVDVDPVSAADLALPLPAEGSAEVAARVAAARAIQTARMAGTGKRSNPVRPEPVEGPSLFFARRRIAAARKEQRFDKLSMDGLGLIHPSWFQS